jgi:PAS domain S-box-containing protein
VLKRDEPPGVGTPAAPAGTDPQPSAPHRAEHRAPAQGDAELPEPQGTPASRHAAPGSSREPRQERADGSPSPAAAFPREEGAMRALAESVPQIVWSTRPDGYHDYFNTRWHAYTGMPRPGEPGGEGEVSQGWQWKDYLHPDDYDRTVAAWQHSLDTGAPYEVEYRFKEAATGQYRWFLARALPQRDAAGRIVRWFGTCTDVHAQREAAADRERLLDAERAARAAAVAAVARTERLQAVTAGLAEALTPGEVAEAVVAHGVAALGAQAGVVLRRSADGRAVELLRALGYSDESQAVWARLPIDAPLPVAEAARTGTLVVVESHAAWDARYPGPGPLRSVPGSQSWAAVPFVLGRSAARSAVRSVAGSGGAPDEGADAAPRVLGVMALSFATPGPPAAADVALMQALAQQCAQALERARLYEAEGAARREAEAANRAKSQFVATMSHELRTPLNAIGGYVQLLEMELHGPVTPEQRTALERVDRAQRHLLGLINDILNLAKIESGKVDYDVQPVGLGELVADVAPMIEPQVAAKRLGYAVQLGDGVAVWADRDKARQVLLNLLSNAANFTEPGGRITVDAVEPPGAPGQVHLRVHDTGAGIPAGALERIFEPFVQVRADRARPQQGTGLGLAISRDLARGMGGDLRAESEPGVGSVFTFVLRRVVTGAGEPTDRRTSRERRARDERRRQTDRRQDDGPARARGPGEDRRRDAEGGSADGGDAAGTP